MNEPEPSPDPLSHVQVAASSLSPGHHLPPAQINLFTGEPEAVVVPIDIEPAEGDERVVAQGIRMVKTGDTSQVVLSGFGMFLSKKSERLLVRDGKTSETRILINVETSFPMKRELKVN